MKNFKEPDDYREFTTPMELHKAINTLKGIVAGITADSVRSEEIDELINWCLSHNHLAHRHPFNELIPFIENICEDNVITDDEIQDLLWMCNNCVSDSDYYTLVTSSLQFLEGMIHGIMSDGELSDSEIYKLKEWISNNDFLSGCYPFDELESLLMTIFNDGRITPDERNMLKAFLSNFVDYKHSYNLVETQFNDLKSKYSIQGICSICQEIDFKGTTFCFTGVSERSTRADISKTIETLGGILKNNISSKTRYLIVGISGNPCWAFSCYGRKIENAINRRKNGQNLAIISEVDFWDIVDDLL